MLPHDETQMAPAFRQRWHLAAFLLFIALMLLLPFLPKPSWLIDRSALYLALPDERGRYDYVANHLLSEKGDIDMLFLGHSGLESAINPVLVKNALRPLLGREPVVHVLGHPTDALDYDFILLKDILSRRNVRWLIWHRKRDSGGEPDLELTTRLWDVNTHWPAIRYLDPKEKLEIYLDSVMMNSRLLASPLKDRQGLVKTEICDAMIAYLGACRRLAERKELAAAIPPVPRLPPSSLIHYRGAGDTVLRETSRYTYRDRVFSDALFRLAAEHHVQIALIQVPYRMEGVPDTAVFVPAMTKDQPGYRAPVIGLPLRTLFPGLSFAEIARIFYIDTPPAHFNWAAADYFTATILPALLDLFSRPPAGVS